MSSTVAKPQPTTDFDVRNNSSGDYEGGEDGEGVVRGVVTSHVCIRPGNNGGTLEKEVVLRQIRQRKRMNGVRGAIQGLFRGLSRPNSNKDKSNGKPRFDERSVSVKWVDAAFAAP